MILYQPLPWKLLLAEVVVITIPRDFVILWLTCINLPFPHSANPPLTCNDQSILRVNMLPDKAASAASLPHVPTRPKHAFCWHPPPLLRWTHDLQTAKPIFFRKWLNKGCSKLATTKLPSIDIAQSLSYSVWQQLWMWDAFRKESISRHVNHLVLGLHPDLNVC